MDWSKWITEQPEEVQDAYRKQVSKLESALESERDAAKATLERILNTYSQAS